MVVSYSHMDFSEKTRDLFDMGGYCIDWEDGCNDADCLHHILGRVSNSPLNAAPLNNFRTHQPEGRKNLDAIHSKECRSRLLKKTKRFLEDQGYQFNKKDLEFLQTYKKYYD